MKAVNLFRVMILLVGVFLSACTGAQASSSAPGTSSSGGDKPLFSEVVFTGVIEGMDGDQWTINGQTIQVDASVLRDGPFVVGDTVKVEARVAQDGAVTAQRVESPSAVDLVEAATSIPGAVSTQTPVVFDSRGTEAVGTVEAITETSITLGGQTYAFAPGAEMKGAIAVGTTVKLHFVTSADGSLSVREIEIVDLTSTNGNSNDDNSNGTSANDDNSNNNSNDDDSNDDNGNDDSSDDNSNDDNGNDDNSNNSNGSG